MTDWLLSIDLFFLKLIHHDLASIWGDAFFPIITDLHKQPWFFGLLLPMLIFLFYKKYARAGITYFLFLVLTLSCSDFIGGKIKKIVERPRPFENAELHVTQKSPAGQASSFYSNHASNNFAFAIYMTNFFPTGKAVFFSIAAMVGYSRIYNGVHFPSDVAFGAFVGLLQGLLFSRLARKLVLFLENRRRKKQS